MHIITILIISLVALAHIWFLLLEMVFWTKPLGMKTFGNTAEQAATTRVLAANQGLYNGFLAAGLIWSLAPIGAESAPRAIATFFLICVVIAGFYGAVTVSRRILYVQAIPALIGLAALWLL